MKPKLLGTKTFNDYPLAELLPYIDWNPFFQVWQLRGKYPNRGYPQIFKDETVGVEAKKLHDDALALIDEVVQKKMLTAKGVVGIWSANAVATSRSTRPTARASTRAPSTRCGSRRSARTASTTRSPTSSRPRTRAWPTTLAPSR